MTLGDPSKASRRIALTAIAGMFLLFPGMYLWGSRASEFDVKAAYLYNFGRFVDWPEDPNLSDGGNFKICVLGTDPFGPSLEATVSGERIAGKLVVARRISSITDAHDCRILFISSSEVTNVKEIVSSLSKLGVLTVSDLPQFLDDGGMVQFVLADRKVRFKINLAATRQAGLNLSSQLLKVAAEVREGSPAGN
jgi:hypothetical protein